MENSELIKNAVRYIDQYCGRQELTIDGVADSAGFSTDYFNRIFRAHTGFNVMEYVRFRTLNRAAVRLRQTDCDILTVALDSGYESPDGFTRAFKAQYGRTPSEYRKEKRGEPVVFADLGMNATAEGQFRAEFPEFRVLDKDEVIDYLLTLNAARFGYEAISIKWNDSCILTDKEPDKDGCYVAADMFFPNGPYLNLKLKSVAELKSYTDRLIRIKPWIIGVTFEEDTDIETVKASLGNLRYKKLTENPEAVYTGEPQPLPEEAKKYSFRYLEPEDASAFEVWARQLPDLPPHTYGLRQTLSVPSADRQTDRPIGMFVNDILIGTAITAPQEVHGFRLNNCILTVMLPGYSGGRETEYLYRFAMNDIIGQGYIPFEDTRFGDYAEEHGGFTATDIGYEITNTCYTIEF